MHRACSHKLTDEAVRKLKEWVEAGGYLFTEDWGLTDMLERAWPDLVGTGSYLPEGEVDVAPARGATTHPLLRGVFVSTKKMIKEEIPDFKERIFYICGPPKMVEAIIGILKNKLGLGEDKIKKENFTGY